MQKINFKSDEPCLCCGHQVENEVTYHHEYSRGGHPENEWDKWNLVSVCLKHHNEIHNKGTVAASEKYPRLKRWLLANGWRVCEIKKAWTHDLVEEV